MHRSLIPAAVALAFAAGPALDLHAAPAHKARRHASAAHAATPSSTPPAAASIGNATTTTQLPRGVVPTHYDVSLTPDAAAGTFSARTVVTITIGRATDRLVLNAADLAFSNATLTPAGHGPALTATSSVDADAQTATFAFDHPVAPGMYKLAMDYTGKIGTQATGLFSLDYDSVDGKPQRALFTQFENSDARRMIPSWDEPAYKATFTLDVTVPAGQMAVSNMPASTTQPLPDGRVHVAFAPTPKMSTYLLFFALGDFERATIKGDTAEIGVVARRGALQQADFALQSGAAILREYNDYFGVRYPLPKLDNIAGPGRSQFFGAMENWGAIFTFEHYLLLDPAISTQNDRQEVFAVAAHEMAHQWFGDLVTMRWWDDLWLNEGFASWMESRTTSRLHPEWNTALYGVTDREAAMDRDSVATTHPVVQHITSVEQANQAFDAITYKKGEAVIRMLEAYVGENGWRNGVRAYMKANAYGNTVSDDFWKPIERAAGKPITAIAHDFTLQPGIPLIRVGEPACEGGKTTVPLVQAEFTRDRPDKKPLAWRVPVIAQVVGQAAGAVRNPTGSTLVTGGAGTVTLPGCGPVVVNAGQSGYYRTLYPAAQLAQLTQGYATLAPIDQIGLLADSAALGMAGLQPAASALDLVKAAPRNGDPQLWSRIAALLDNVHNRYRGDAARQARFDAFALAQLRPVFAQTGWTARTGEAPSVANLRDTLIGVLSDLGDPATVAEARRRYAAMATDPQAVPGPLRKVVTAAVARHADAATWDALHARARAEKTPLVKSQLYDMLGAAADPRLAQRALQLALTDEPGATNAAAIVSSVARGHPELAVDFTLANLPKVNAIVDETSRSRFVARLGAGSSDPAMVAKLQGYGQANLAAGSRGDLDAAIAAVQDNVRVNAARLPEIDAWLQRQGQRPGQ
jgi:aminopeptidase N